MNNLPEKQMWIENQEQRFALQLAADVIPAPQLSFWMVLIPILIVYHLFRHNRIVNSRKAFAEHYMLSRRRALQEAYGAISETRTPDIGAIADQATGLPDVAAIPYRLWIECLVEHYLDLLNANGSDYNELIRHAYRTRTNYLLFMNRAHRLEQTLHQALKDHVAGTSEDVAATITHIQNCTAQRHRDQADAFFA
jgi:hypothetical protein